MSWDDRDTFEVLDEWYVGWMKQYCEDDVVELVAAQEIRRSQTNDAGVQKALDDIITSCSVEDLHEGATTWYSNRNRSLLYFGLHLRDKDVREAIDPAIYSSMVQPYVSATRGLLLFVSTIETLREYLGTIDTKTINNIFVFSYDTLDGFIEQEKQMQQLYGNAARIGGQVGIYEEEDVDYHSQYGSLIGDAQAQVYRAAFRGIEEYRPVKLGKDLLLSNNGKPIKIVPPEIE
jgi:hypothetical protein